LKDSIVPVEFDIRAVLLGVIDRQDPKGNPSRNLQSSSILVEAADTLKFRNDREKEQALLTQFHDLFRTGYLAWGLDISNPNPPFFHLTAQGRRTLARLSHDPGNPEGYLGHVYAGTQVNAVTRSYLEEGVRCYVGALYKASAVMVGAADESVILELRSSAETRLKTLGRPVPKGLKDWRVKVILDALSSIFDIHKGSFPKVLRDEYDGYWSAFTQQIRATRNEAGHPSSIDPISPQTIHGSLLIFPELLKLADKLKNWIDQVMA
jgi:hypothetical protein